MGEKRAVVRAVAEKPAEKREVRAEAEKPKAVAVAVWAPGDPEAENRAVAEARRAED